MSLALRTQMFSGFSPKFSLMGVLVSGVDEAAARAFCCLWRLAKGVVLQSTISFMGDIAEPLLAVPGERHQ